MMKMLNCTKLAVFSLALIFCATFYFPKNSFAVTCDANIDGKSDSDLQAILSACDREIAAQQAILDENQKEQVSLNQGISELNASISKSNLEINAQNAQIKQLGSNITQKQQYIGELSNQMDDIEKSIAQIIRQSFAIQNNNFLEVFLSSENLSDFIKNSDNYSTVNGKLHNLALQLGGIKTTTESEKRFGRQTGGSRKIEI